MSNKNHFEEASKLNDIKNECNQIDDINVLENNIEKDEINDLNNIQGNSENVNNECLTYSQEKIEIGENNEALENNEHATTIPSKKTMSTVKKILLFFACCFVITIIGCGIASYMPIGFVLMGVGMNGFILFIVIAVCKSNMERTKYSRYLTTDKTLLNDFYDIKIGIVTKCQMHSRAYTSSKVSCYSGDLYKIWVILNDDKLDNATSDKKIDGTKVELSQTKINYKMLSKKQYKIGDKVEFYQNKTNYKDCYLIK